MSTSIQAPGDFALVKGGRAAPVVVDAADAKVVQIASGLFAADVRRVTEIQPAVTHLPAGLSGEIVLLGTIGQSSNLAALIASGKMDVGMISGKWECYQVEVVERPFPGVPRALVVAGSDRRGTAYGALALSEAMGVSPWYWWADVPPKRAAELYVSAKRFVSKEPSVRYRGIFINDEDWGLQEWSEKNFESAAGEVKDIGPKSYAKIFELLLRLKANLVWPAMHPSTAAFNAYADNKVVADDYAIVMGSSHAEPMLRNNVHEWSRFVDPVTGQNYSNKEWNYQLNRNGVYRYWEQRVVANGSYENIYTLGKRGIHDSGMVEGSTAAEKATWLNAIFADQRQILTNHVASDATKIPQIFVPYKEVLGLYDSGLVHVPDDVTLVWPDDNHGYIRRLSDPAEQQRAGGGGVYYHLSYWGAPADYLWLCSTPPALIWEELTKAHAYNCHRLWVINVGDIKPAEICMEFALRLAWDVGRYDENAQTVWLAEWASREFGAEHAAEIASVLNEYYRLGFARKPEHMNWIDTDALSPAGPRPLFSHVHFDDEASRRLGAYANLSTRAEAVCNRLPAAMRSAFYQTVLYPIRGADGMNRKFLNAGRAHLASVQGRNSVAAHYAASQRGYDDIQSETATYNSIEGGKWKEMMDSKPRRLAVFDKPALPVVAGLNAGVLGVAIEGRAEPVFLTSTGLVFQPRPAVRPDATPGVVVEDGAETSFQLPEFNGFTRGSNFVDLFNTGTGSLAWRATPADSWLRVSETSGTLTSESRLWITVDWASAPRSDALSSSLALSSGAQTLTIPVRIWNPPQLPPSVDFVEENRAVAIEAEHYSALKPGADSSWVAIPNLGSGAGAMTIAPVTAASRSGIVDVTNASAILEYNVFLRSTGMVTVISRFIPTLPINRSRGLRHAISFDNETPQIVDMDRASGSGSVWSRSVLRSAIDYTTTHSISLAGQHTLKIWMVDPGVVLDRMVIATGPIPYSYGGPLESAVNRSGTQAITNDQSTVASPDP